MGVAERRQREKEQRRKEIVDAAEKIIFRDGFSKASMEQVANEAELSKATLYLYFKSKEELYFAIFLRGQELLYKMIDEELAKHSATKEKLQAFLKSLVGFQKKHPEYFEAFFYFTTNRVELNKQSEDFISNHEQDTIYLKKWIEIIKKGKEDKIIRQDLDPIPSVLLIWLQSVGMLKIYSVVKAELEEMFGLKEGYLLDSYFDLVLRGLYAK